MGGILPDRHRGRRQLLWMAADEDHYFIPANGEEMNSDDDESSERDEMDDDSLGEDGDDNDNDDDDDDDDDDSTLGSDLFQLIVETWEEMEGRLQSCIESVSLSQSFNLCLRHIVWDQQQLLDNEEPIVWHEAILDHYWDQLDNEIKWRKQLGIVTKIEGTIHIENVEMSKERLATLVTTLSGQVNKIETILIDNVNLCEEGIISLSKLVDVSSQLQTFCLHNNRIDNMDSARCISKSLKSHVCINSLNLTHSL